MTDARGFDPKLDGDDPGDPIPHAPERTPLSERMRWDNCICGKGNPNGIGQSGDDWDLDTQCAYCDDADEVAALEQELEQGRTDWREWRQQAGETVAALEQELETSRRASKVELDRLNEVVADYIQTNERLRAERDRFKRAWYAIHPLYREAWSITKPDGEE